MSYVTLNDILKEIGLTFATTILGDEAMLEHNHEEQSRNWPPPHNELDKFKHSSCIDGYSHFVMTKSWLGVQKDVFLLLCPKDPMRGTLTVAKCDSNLKWFVTCDHSMANAVAAVIPQADTFLRNLLKQPERPKLPEDCEWFEIGNELFVRDKRSCTVYPVPTDARRADILDSVAKEFRRTHKP